MLTIKDILIAARALIDTPEAWIKGVLAQQKDGRPTTVSNSKASCFCAVGAIRAAAARAHTFLAYPAISTMEDILFNGYYGHSDLTVYNDSSTTTHADILNLFDKAIASC